MATMQPRPDAGVRRRTRLRTKLLLALGTALATLASVEGALWLLHPLPLPPAKLAHRFLPSYFAYAPAPRTIEFDPGTLPDVTPGVRSLQINRYGFLYPEADRARREPTEVRIAAIGGSTVECAALPDDKRWPAVLAELLQKELPGRRVTVLNLGLSAMDTRTHLATMCQHVPSLDVDMVVFMLGANDLSRVAQPEFSLLSSVDFYEPATPGKALRELLRQTQIGRHLDAWKERRAPAARSTPYYEKQAKHRAALPELDRALQLGEPALAGYATSIVTLAGICRELGITPVFTTQPTMLTRTPTPAEEATLWGFDFDDHRVPAAVFVDLLAALNQRLLATCADRGYAAVDLAARIPKGLGCFYDQVHFTETGAQKVAAELAPVVLDLLAHRPARR